MSDLPMFEQSLDDALAARTSLLADGCAALRLALNILDACYEGRPDLAPAFRRGLSILAPRYLLATGQREPQIDEVLADLEFASHYYNLRELLYYGYNAGESVDWAFDGLSAKVTFTDPSVHRQYFTTANNSVVAVKEIFDSYVGGERIEELIADAYIEGTVELSKELSSLIEAEIDLKLAGYYTLLPPTAEHDLGGYKYSEFIQVFRVMLGNALVHRYQGRAHNRHGAVSIRTDELLASMPEVTGISLDACRRILRAMTFTQVEARRGVEASYFTLFELGPGEATFVPSDYLVHEGIVSFLRLLALRKPNHFLANVSDPLGRALVDRVAEAFRAQSFSARTNVSLVHLDPWRRPARC